MAPLTFADMHNMVAYLSKSDASEGFDQIMDFLNAHTIQYALVVDPTIYVSCIKQFWATATVKKFNDVVHLRALIDGKKVVVSEAIIRRDLHLDDVDGVECLSNEEIFKELARMRYENPPPKLTLYKAFFCAMEVFDTYSCSDPTPTPHAIPPQDQPSTPYASPPQEKPTTTSESSIPLLTTLLETYATPKGGKIESIDANEDITLVDVETNKEEIHTEGTRVYWKIIRVGGITEAYQSFEDMLRGFDRENLVALWNLVKEKFSLAGPSKDKEKALWVELKRLFEPDADDVLWKLERYMHAPLTWKLHTDYGVHHVSLTRGYGIFMLIEKDYPLSNAIMILMLSGKLQVEEDSKMARDLVMKIFMELKILLFKDLRKMHKGINATGLNITAAVLLKNMAGYKMEYFREKDIPLSNAIMILLLSGKLQVEEDSEMTRDLVMKIFMEANKLKIRNLRKMQKRINDAGSNITAAGSTLMILDKVDTAAEVLKNLL
uniref:Xylulose kinase-1 n=1 Tax=Tanacetum cinerariifolium TaxID=118510 RepID=A0A6L2NVP7_TANCI|nr:hypothetical protein [Tanacetum cinerariifolium]